MKTIRIITAIMVVATFMLLIKGCKKVENTSNSKDVELAKTALIKSIKEQYGDVSAGIVIPVNKQAEDYFYKDANGKMVSLYGIPTGQQGITAPAPCKANCNSTTNPADLRIIYTLDYVQRFYICEVNSTNDKSTVSVKWTVSVPFNLGYTIGFPVQTYGTVRFKNSSGTVINTLQANTGQLTETMVGADPACPTWNNLWTITYKFTQVANSNFASGNTIEAAVSLENDCSLVGNVVASGNISAPSFSQNANLPCNRIDKVWANATTPAIVIGNTAAVCTQPSGFNYVDFHQLEYRPVNSPTGSLKWEDQTSASNVSWGLPFGSSILNPAFAPSNGATLTNITSGSGLWLIRYRNVKTGTCNIINPLPLGPPNGNWGNNALWVTEAWSY